MDKKRRTAEAAETTTEAAGVNITTPVDVAAMKKMVTDFQEGMQMVLEGYSKVFSSLAGMQPSVINTSTDTTDSADSVVEAAAGTAFTPAVEKSEEKTVEVPEKASDDKPSKKTKKSATETKEENTETTDASSTISYDDLKRVVIAKIEQKQENNQKIGELVKKYGVKNIGELDAKQREAFMSELAAI